MSKIITSPVRRYPGTVKISDPLTFPQAFAFSDALDAARALDENATLMQYNHVMLAGICVCVEEWHIQGLPEVVDPDTFPATPARASAELAAWLISEVANLFAEAETVPNG